MLKRDESGSIGRVSNSVCCFGNSSCILISEANHFISPFSITGLDLYNHKLESADRVQRPGISLPINEASGQAPSPKIASPISFSSGFPWLSSCRADHSISLSSSALNCRTSNKSLYAERSSLLMSCESPGLRDTPATRQASRAARQRSPWSSRR